MKDCSSRSTTSHTSLCSSSFRLELDPELEQLAEDFQAELEDNGFLQDQKCVLTKRVKLSNVFTGKDAVTTLQSLMPRQTTREKACEKANEMMIEFSFFKHVSGQDKPLMDSASDFYQFDHNLPTQVQKVKDLYVSYWDKAWLIEQHIECKDRRHKFCTYPNCFVAKEAVDVLMKVKLVKSRREAVYLLKKLNEKVHFYEPASAGQEFKDEHLFFYLVPANQRRKEPPRKHHRKKKDPADCTSQTSGHTRSSMKSSRTHRSTLSRADSVRSGLTMHREEQLRMRVQQQFPVNAPRGS